MKRHFGRQRVNVDTPFGSVHVDGQKNAPIDLGDIPIYPGAERAKKEDGGSGAVIEIRFWGNGAEAVFRFRRLNLLLDDSVSTVREWYRKAGFPVGIRNGKEMTRVENGIRRVISVKERDGRTQNRHRDYRWGSGGELTSHMPFGSLKHPVRQNDVAFVRATRWCCRKSPRSR